MPISIGSDDLTGLLADRVREASARRAPLRLVGGDTKAFLGRRTDGGVLDLSGHRGVTAYEPSELVITARAGTRLAEIETLLAEHGQMLAFEAPNFGDASTIGGAVAAGLAGARRPFVGAVRDFLLGVTVLDGRGAVLRFGGTVFKNVAGFDAFRLMAGAMGRLGVLLDVSLRVTPAPRARLSRAFEGDWPAARRRLNELMRRPLPLSGAFHDGQRLFIRLSGAPGAVAEASAEIGGEDTPLEVWDDLRRFRIGPMAAERLWRLSLPRTRDPATMAGACLIDWAGGQRWLASDAPPEAVRAAAAAVGGHATLFRGAAAGEAVFAPLPPPLMDLHRRLAAAMDQAGVFNPGRMYEGL